MINPYVSAVHNTALKEMLKSLEPIVGQRRLAGLLEVLKRN